MYFRKNIVISIKNANICSLVILAIITVGIIMIISEWEIDWTKEYIASNFVNYNVFIMYFLFALSIPVHECIHAIMFMIYLRDVKGIKIGFDYKNLTPYCSCSVPIRLWQYIISMLMPVLILGILPALFAIANQNVVWILWSAIEISSSGVDIIIALMGIFEGKYTKYVIDHPTQVGYTVVMDEQKEYLR